MPGNQYTYAAAKHLEEEVLHSNARVFFKRRSVQNEPDVNAVIMTQISLKASLNKWVEKGRGSVHSDMKQLHMRDILIPIHNKYLT